MGQKKFKNFTGQYPFEKKSQHQRESMVFSTSKEAKQVSSFLFNHVIYVTLIYNFVYHWPFFFQHQAYKRLREYLSP